MSALYVSNKNENMSETHMLDAHAPRQYINRNNAISTESCVRTYDELVHMNGIHRTEGYKAIKVLLDKH
jgi:hypothetical protein